MPMRRSAFTLIEVLISIALLSFVLLALYKSVSMLQSSNVQLFQHLERADNEKRGTETLFLDIAGSDGNLTIAGDEFSRLCLLNTVNSLYGLSAAKVCWVVSKKTHTLLRSEGNGYTLPLNSDDRVAVDAVMEDIDLFRVYRKKGNALVMLRQKGKKSISFLVQGVPEAIKKKKKKKLKKKTNKKPSRQKPSKNTPGNTPAASPSVPKPPTPNSPAA
jgi:prepilin-type N-terminal cleavage/methylation domain-containing protein